MITGRSCPACRSVRRTRVGEKNGFALSRCCSCRTLYAHDETGAATGEDYDAYYTAANLDIPAFVSHRLDEIVKGFEPYRRTNRLLDVGCGAGTLMEAARRAGWRAEGVEISEPAVRHVRSLGFAVFHGELSAAGFEPGRFDVVTASECLEHIEDPISVAVSVHKVLRAGGLFWGTTPHGRGLSVRLLGTAWSTVTPPDHLQLYSMTGLQRLLRMAGFGSVRAGSRSFNPAEVLHALGGLMPWRGSSVDHRGFDRVSSGYALNAAMTRSAVMRRVKGVLNGLLRASSLGDSIEFSAVASRGRAVQNDDLTASV